jgi:hypothetical protein
MFGSRSGENRRKTFRQIFMGRLRLSPVSKSLNSAPEVNTTGPGMEQAGVEQRSFPDMALKVIQAKSELHEDWLVPRLN